MVHGFDTTDEHAATAALLVYAAWRSRDKRRFKITPDVWGQVERFVKSSAKRATTLAEFLERLKPRLLTATINPRYCASDWQSIVQMERLPDGTLVERAGTGRAFLTRVLEQADHRAVLRKLYAETCLVILLVRDRIERERPHEGIIEAADDETIDGTVEFASLSDVRQMYEEDEEAGVYRDAGEG